LLLPEEMLFNDLCESTNSVSGPQGVWVVEKGGFLLKSGSVGLGESGNAGSSTSLPPISCGGWWRWWGFMRRCPSSVAGNPGTLRSG
jgi:hypothetical protein